MIVGIDWATDKHDALLMHEHGRTLAALRITHDAEGFHRLAASIAEHEPDPRRVRLAIEMHDGALLAFLLEQGYTVYGVNPKSAQRARDRYRPAGGKDDASDAFILADMLRTDRGHLRPIRPDSEATEQLRALVQLRIDRVQERTAFFHRLRDRLQQWSPDLARLCDDFNRLWQRDLLRDFPLQQELHEAHGRTLNAFIRRHRLAAPTAERIHQARKAQPIFVPAARLPALRLDIHCLLEQIEVLCDAIGELEDRIEHRVREHPDAQLFESLPVKASTTIGALLAGFGEDRDGAPDHRQLAAAWGVAPVTVQSGKHRSVRCRRAADRTMRHALTYFALNTIRVAGSWAARFYQRKRQEGMRHHAALRCLAQRWIKIIHAMWRHRQPYDELRHRRNQQHPRNNPLAPTPG